MSIYKPGEICGQVESELSADLYQRWGHILGMQIEPQAKVIVGGDNRASTPAYREALISGLCQAGANVVNLGEVTTPMVSYARRRLGGAAYAMVTASHRPANFNGLKWMIGRRSPQRNDVEKLERTVEPNGTGSTRMRGSWRDLDISFDYVGWLQQTWVESMGARLRVVLDPLYGTCAARARRYLQAILPCSLFSAIHDEPDAALGNAAPDCSDPERLRELAAAVEHEGADLGIALDGDGDCLALVDGEGVTLSADELACVFLYSFGEALAGQPFVYDWGFSQQVAAVARSLGAEALAGASNYAAIRARMLDTGAAFAAGTNGHYFFRPLEAGDDGLFAACWLLDWLNHTGLSLADARRRCPPVYMTPELHVAAEAAQQATVLADIAKAWAGHTQATLDGLRIEFPQGWALVRSRPEESDLAFRFEARDWESLRELVWRYCEVLDDLGDQLWTCYSAALGTAGTK